MPDIIFADRRHNALAYAKANRLERPIIVVSAVAWRGVDIARHRVHWVNRNKMPVGLIEHYQLLRAISAPLEEIEAVQADA